MSPTDRFIPDRLQSPLKRRVKSWETLLLAVAVAIFTFNAGRPVFELVDPDGQRWVMQTWSQTVDKNLSLNDLPGLASRLTLPDGWSYQTRTLSSPLRVDTTHRDAHVTQDDLANSYSLQFQ